jgi:RNA polymerase sigma-70 factor (ECF subfamily)
MPIKSSFQFSAALSSVVEVCWEKAAHPHEWNLTREQFRLSLERSVARRFGDSQPDAKTVQTYLETLHLTDLALAGACSAGNASAWDFFVAQYRPGLYRAARAIAGDSTGRELADSLYADLFGLQESEGRRNSLFDYFHGRSKLGTWLRAVLAQRHVDEIRRARRTDPLAEDSGNDQAGEARTVKAPVINDPTDLDRARFVAMLQGVLSVVLLALDPRDRLRLAYYYVDELTLAQIGRLLAEHEATVSRKLDRTRNDVRKRVETALRGGKKLSEAQVRLCYEYAQEEWPFDLTQLLSGRQ